YRHVRLRLTDPLHIAHWGTFVTTPVVSARTATVKIATTIANESTATRSFVLESEIALGDNIVAHSSTPASLAVNERQALAQDIELPAPRRWTLDSPVLYTLRQRV